MTYKAILAVALLGFACLFSDSQRPTKEKSAVPVVRESVRSDISPMGTSSPLPSLAQSVVSATLGRDVPLYRVRAEGRGFQAENVRHGLAASFTSQRVEVGRGNARWAVALRGYGYGNAVRPVDMVAPEAGFNRV